MIKKMIAACLCGLLCATTLSADFKIKEAPLMTKWAKDVDIKCPHPEYPRPQMERKDWLNLNGIWEFQKGAAGDEIPFGKKLEGQILVPFAVESALSGVMEQMDRLWYRRTFELPADWKNKRIMLNFGAVDYESEVWVNGKNFGIHKGGYLPFSYDITNAMEEGENELIVRVFDPTDKGGQPRGKQDTQPQGIMYTPTTGIWQTVWLEPLSPIKDLYIKDIKVVTDIDKEEVSITAFCDSDDFYVTFQIVTPSGEEIIAEGKPNKPTTVKIKNPRLWSPDDPYLYEFTARLSTKSRKQMREARYKLPSPDVIKSYFGMRKISVEKIDGHMRICLNNKPIFMNGPLDQGYWPDGILTAPTDEALRFDLEQTKAYGFNFTRKHIKVEPARWYYWADKMGLMVWQDAPSCNSYNGHHKHKPVIDKQAFEDGLVGMIDFLKNSPSVVTWVVFNESQGQYDTERLAELVEKLDPTRLVNEASGDKWYGKGHIRDIHHYPSPRSPEPNGYQAIACGEFGGIGLPVEGHLWFNEKRNWGYTNVSGSSDLLFKYADYYDMIRKMRDEKGLSAVVYTQITDVMTEVNGLFTYDRMPKVPAEEMRKINDFKFKMPDYKAFLPTSENEPQLWVYSENHIGAWQMPRTEDDSAFKSGLAPFGEASGRKGNTEWKSPDIWLRRTFKVGEISQDEISRMMLRVMHDENFIVFINGVEAFQKGGYITDYEYCPISRDALATIKPNSENTIAVYCHNTVGGQFIDVGIYIRGELEFID